MDLMIAGKSVAVDIDEFSGDREFIYYEGEDGRDPKCKKTSFLINFEPLDISVP